MQTFLSRLSQLLRGVSTVLIALVLALIVWLIAVDEENPFERRDFATPLPIVVRGLGEDLQPLQDLSKATATLNLRAPRRTWENVSADDFDLYIDLTNLGPNVHEVEVKADILNPDVTIMEINPSRLRVQLEPVISKEVAVQVTIMDSAAVGYDEQTPVSVPPTVTIKGPATQVNQVTFAVAQIYLREARSRVEESIRVTPRNSQNQPTERVTVEPAAVQVTVPIVQREGRRSVTVLVVPEGQPANGYSMSGVQVDPPTIVLLGSPDTLSNLPGFVTTTAFSIQGVTEDVKERLALQLPENVSSEVDSVTVTVSITPIEGKTTVTRSPIFRGLGDGLTASVSPETADVFLSGPLPRLDALSPDDVRVVLDLNGLSPGSHVIEPIVIAPEGVISQGTLPQVIEVVIQAPPTPTPDATTVAESTVEPRNLPEAGSTPTAPKSE